LFVVGCPRSGTTALANYLNQHEELLLCVERYKYVRPTEVTPDLFTFERILDYREGETNIPKQRHAELLARKDPERLKWVGEKMPTYYKWYFQLLENNPGARFIVIHRPVEEVAESFEARARQPQDSWPHGFEEGVKRWNQALRLTRKFVESEKKPEVLILHYHDFFYRNETCVPLISRFLEIEFDEPVLEAWRKRSERFEAKRRNKEPLDEERAAFVRENKNQAAEEWLFERIEEQRNGLMEIAVPLSDKAPKQYDHQGRKEGDAEHVRPLTGRLEKERRKAERLGTQSRRLTLELRKLRGSKVWRLAEKLGRIVEKMVPGSGR
jgi:hypothetical protein